MFLRYTVIVMSLSCWKPFITHCYVTRLEIYSYIYICVCVYIYIYKYMCVCMLFLSLSLHNSTTSPFSCLTLFSDKLMHCPLCHLYIAQDRFDSIIDAFSSIRLPNMPLSSESNSIPGVHWRYNSSAQLSLMKIYVVNMCFDFTTVYYITNWSQIPSWYKM